MTDSQKDVIDQPDFLGKNEKAMWFGRPRLITYFKWFLLLVALSAITTIILSIITTFLFSLLGILLFVIGLIVLLTRWRGHRFWFTNQRGIKEFTWLSRDSMEAPTERITNARVDQSLLGRILNYGSVYLDTAGGPIEEIEFQGIPDPSETSDKLFELLQETKTEPVKIQEEARKDPMEKLDKLNDLKKKGAISQEEFEEKKQDLLDQM